LRTWAADGSRSLSACLRAAVEICGFEPLSSIGTVATDSSRPAGQQMDSGRADCYV
jgi:osmotically-inducible protein OsmY